MSEGNTILSKFEFSDAIKIVAPSIAISLPTSFVTAAIIGSMMCP